MGDWTYGRGCRIEHGGAQVSDSHAQTVSPNATANTKGNWFQMISATTVDTIGFFLLLQQADQTYHTLFDIGVGGSGSEQVLISNVMWGTGCIRQTAPMFFPLAIPRGSRVAVRCQIRTASASAPPCSIMFVGAGGPGPIRAFNACDTYGANTADSGGVSVDSGGTANTKSAYVQLAASTVRAHKSLIVLSQNADNTVVLAANCSYLADIAVGGVGSERILLPNLQFRASSASNGTGHWPPYYGPFPCDIPAGSRLSVRMQSSSTDAQDRVTDFALYGLS